jgi:hypothetical protein
MNTAKFDSVLTAFKLVKRGEDSFWNVQFKVSEETSIRTFPRQFSPDIDFNGVFDQSAVNDAWDKTNIPVSDYNLHYMIDFSELTFEAKFLNIAAVRKHNNDDTWRTDYTLSFLCDPDKDTIKKLVYYVNRKEVNPMTGKKEVVAYPTVLNPVEDQGNLEPSEPTDQAEKDQEWRAE